MDMMNQTPTFFSLSKGGFDESNPYVHYGYDKSNFYIFFLQKGGLDESNPYISQIVKNKREW